MSSTVAVWESEVRRTSSDAGLGVLPSMLQKILEVGGIRRQGLAVFCEAFDKRLASIFVSLQRLRRSRKSGLELDCERSYVCVRLAA